MGKLKFLYVREILSEFAGTFILMVSRWYNQLCLPLALVALVIQSAYFNKGRSLFLPCTIVKNVDERQNFLLL